MVIENVVMNFLLINYKSLCIGVLFGKFWFFQTLYCLNMCYWKYHHSHITTSIKGLYTSPKWGHIQGSTCIGSPDSDVHNFKELTGMVKWRIFRDKYCCYVTMWPLYHCIRYKLFPLYCDNRLVMQTTVWGATR